MEPADRDRSPAAAPLASPSAQAAHPQRPTPRAAEPKRQVLGNLALRLITAALLIPPVIWVCYVGGWLFVAVIVGFSLLGLNEFYDLISAKGATPHRLLGNVAAGFLPVIAYIGDASLATSALTVTLLTLMILQLTKQQIRQAIASVSETFFGVIYVGWLLSYAVSVRFISLASSSGVSATASIRRSDSSSWSSAWWRWWAPTWGRTSSVASTAGGSSRR